MAAKKQKKDLKVDAQLRQITLAVGRDSSGVVCRIIRKLDVGLVLQRQPYVSPIDGWRQEYPDLPIDPDNSLWLLNTIKNSPAEWPD
ncbi:hypothetical protein [Fibrella forsythiae]|uniref:Uncharacterized protein n=1 Tax=Fibrella forsythiae TaxID=2817061 RepID=A0ABS3JC41_9BACT|nr:hypothetical protein [Fibrella forsythiae]MBO0947553.1 hypothetical protein [Fibrella forsythiae]